MRSAASPSRWTSSSRTSGRTTGPPAASSGPNRAENPSADQALNEATSGLSVLRERYGERYRWLLLLSVMIGTMASIMSSTIVNVAIPDMSHHFTLGQERAQWVSSGFMVAMTVSMLTTPWLLARYGYRRTYSGCMWLLMAGGIVGGLANNYALVLLARVAEGLAAGVVQPIPAIIIMRAFQPHEQGRASGVFGMGVVLAPAIGPSIGGVLVDLFGWRSIFFMVVPFCIASLIMARKFVPVTSPGGLAANRQGAALDWRGLVLGAVGTLCLLNGLVELRNGPPAVAAGLLLGALAALVTFIWWQRHAARQGREPLMNLALFGYRQFAMGSIVAFIYGTALFGSTYLLPVYMQLGLGLSASYVGTILLPAGFVLAVTIATVGRLADRHPTYLLVSIGLVLLAASFALMITIGLTSAIWLLVAWAILGRIGLGFILPSLNLGSMRGLDKDLVPQGSSTINFVRMLGGAAGVSLCAIVLEWRLAAHGDSLTVATTSVARLAAFNESFLMLAALCGLATIAAWQLRIAKPPAPVQPPAQ
ncbi:MAG: MFS transporter [Comamonadaceae bacterium]|nr:MAG: MFS transporter [Comamonadaceae bacterium]